MPRRRVRYPADSWRGLVRQDPARGAPRHRHGDGPEGSAQTLHQSQRLLPGVPLRPASRRAQEHHHDLRRGLRDGRLLRFFSGICSIRWV